ncbi:nitrilase-like protein, partial [Piedraia hortae CBS 480.64]
VFHPFPLPPKKNYTPNKTQVLFLPEASDFIASSPHETLSLTFPVSKSPFVQGLVTEAKIHSLSLSVGIHEPSPTPQKVSNTLIWISPEGVITNRYQKLHLFDLDLSSTGGAVLSESTTTEPGATLPEPFSSPIGKIGPMICFDLRFPQVSLALRRMGAEVLLYPSAFTVQTGRRHWEVLLRARAIECQCYVVAAAQRGWHSETRESYGHGMVVDPCGEVVAEVKGEGVGVEVVEVDLGVVRETRRGLPLCRRTDVYPEV